MTDYTDEVLARHQRVLDVIEEDGWSSERCSALAEEFGVKKPVVRKYRVAALRLKAAELAEVGREGERAEFLANVERARQKTETAGEYGPLSSMLRIQQTALGIEKSPQEQPPPQAEDIVETVALLLRSDAETREAVTAALAADGWVLTLERGG